MNRHPAIANGGPRRRGIVAVLVAVALIVLVGAAALALDAGRLFDRRWQAQAAAEAAAMAAAIDLFNSSGTKSTSQSEAKAIASARSIAADNGFAAGGQASTVTVNIPPKSGAFSGKNGYVEVIIEYRQTRGFSNVFGSEPSSVVARAVAGGTAEYTPGSVLVLHPKKKRALSLNKNGSQLVVDGAVAVNSKAKNSVKVGKGSRIKAADVMVSGGIDKQSRRRIDGPVHTKAPATEDPLAGLPPPAAGPTRKLSDYKSGNSYVLEPGSYKEKLEFNGTDTVILKPGVYHLASEGLKLKGNASLIGSGVLIYGASGKHIEFATRGTVDLSPPTTGPYAGVLIFQNPDKTGGVGFKNGRDYDIDGTIYAPNGRIKFKNTDIDMGDEDEDEDEDEEDDDSEYSESESAMAGSFDYSTGMKAQLVARTLSIDKKSSVTIRGTGLNLLRPLLAIVE